MDVPTLMQKLMEIDRALDRNDRSVLRNLLIEAEDGVLDLERENEELALENAGLRQRLADARYAAMAAHRQPANGAGLAPEPTRRATLSAEGSPADYDLDADGSRPPNTWRVTHFFFS